MSNQTIALNIANSPTSLTPQRVVDAIKKAQKHQIAHDVVCTITEIFIDKDPDDDYEGCWK